SVCGVASLRICLKQQQGSNRWRCVFRRGPLCVSASLRPEEARCHAANVRLPPGRCETALERAAYGMTSPGSATYDLFAVTAHGLEQICASELAALGVDGKPETGGVAWRGDMRSLYRANLELRTASRVIARAGEFRARG